MQTAIHPKVMDMMVRYNYLVCQSSNGQIRRSEVGEYLDLGDRLARIGHKKHQLIKTNRFYLVY